jgi:hypothetical protein
VVHITEPLTQNTDISNSDAPFAKRSFDMKSAFPCLIGYFIIKIQCSLLRLSDVAVPSFNGYLNLNDMKEKYSYHDRLNPLSLHSEL